MRLTKTGIALTVMVALMVLGGAFSAVATGSTVLCTEHPAEKCPENSVKQYASHVEALSTHTLLKAGFTLKCTHSLISGNALGLASPLVVHVTKLEFSGCSGTVKVIDKTGFLLLTRTALNLGEIQAHGFEVLAELLGEHCVYGGVLEAHAEGGNPATIKANEVALEELEGGFFCPNTAKWTATYTVVLPKPIYIASPAGASKSTVLCTEHPAEKCPENSVKQYASHVEALSTHTLLKAGFTLKCTHSLISGNALGLASPLVVHVTKLEFSGCSGTVKVIDKTGFLLLTRTALNLGEIQAHGFEVLAELLGEHCVYGGVLEAHAEGGNPATIKANEVALEELEGGFFCPNTAKWTATYTVVLPKPIYLSS